MRASLRLGGSDPIRRRRKLVRLARRLSRNGGPVFFLTPGGQGYGILFDGSDPHWLLTSGARIVPTFHYEQIG
jgi:hypothetical protein